MTDVPQTTARRAGVGVAWLTAAKFYFMATGLLLLLVLPALFKRFAGEQHVALYGDYRTVAGLANWFNMVFIGGTIQAVSKFVSEDERRTWSVKWQTLRIQIVLGGAACAALFLPADLIATHAYNHPGLAIYLRLAAPVVLLYACYAVIIGCMNGLGRFRHQATMDMTFATLKIGLTIALVAAGYAIAGAISAFVLTAAIMLVVSAFVLGRHAPGERVSWSRILAFEWKTLLFAFFLNGLLQVDLQILKAMAPAALGTSSDQAGVYGAAQQIGQIPYVATLSVAFVVFPLISRSVFDKEIERTREYVATTNRYVWIALVGIVLPFVIEPAGILDLVYPVEYTAGAPSFALLCIAYLFFAGMVVNANILTGAGSPGLSASIFATALAMAAGLCLALVPKFGGPGAAASMGIAMLCGFLAFGVVSLKRFGTFLPVRTLLKTLAAAGFLWVAGYVLLPQASSAPAVVLKSALVPVAYAALLVLMREISPSQILAALRSKKR